MHTGVHRTTLRTSTSIALLYAFMLLCHLLVYYLHWCTRENCIVQYANPRTWHTSILLCHTPSTWYKYLVVPVQVPRTSIMLYALWRRRLKTFFSRFSTLEMIEWRYDFLLIVVWVLTFVPPFLLLICLWRDGCYLELMLGVYLASWSPKPAME